MTSDDDDFFPQSNHPGEIVYTEAYSFIFENPNWLNNVLMVLICQFIPVVGPLCVMGYQFVLIESLHRYPQRNYPDFDFNRFVEYLTRGLWPFLVGLVVSLILLPIMGVIIFVVMISIVGVGGANGPDAAGVAFLVGMPLMFLGIMCAGILLNVVIIPMSLKAGLSQDFATAFDWTFIKDFFSKVWWEMILEMLFLQVTAIVVVLLGALVFCIGIYPAAAIVMLAQAHLQYQLYELYLSRGGMPIPLKLNQQTGSI